ncbi:MAG TPA: MarR family winged helix-turn-helix transcriptional regulator [Puia sp.]
MSGLTRSVIPLLSAWEKYSNENPEGDLAGFANWILAAEQPIQSNPPANPAQGALLIARNHDILRLFTKPVVKDLGFSKDVEFSAIAHVAVMDQPNKKQLCHELLIENSTGVEITRRLAQKGFIAERPDPEDRRSALLSITDKGRRTLEQANYRLSPIHTSFLDALDAGEKNQLVSWLSRINKFHSDRINSRPAMLD